MSDPRLLNIHDLGRVGVWPADVRRIDRRSPYGNPFRIADMCWMAVALTGRNDEPGRRAASIALYRAWLNRKPLRVPEATDTEGGTLEFEGGRVVTMAQHIQGIALLAFSVEERATLPPVPDLESLRGHRLACWCAPLPCHGDVILEWLDSHPVRP